MTDTPRTGLEFVDAGTTDIDQPVNNNALALDAVVGMSVVSATTTAEPTLTSPADDGKVYILPAGRTGTNWAAQAVGTIAQWYSGNWYFYAPWAGLQARAADSGIRYEYTSSWAVWASVDAQLLLTDTDVPRLGTVNTWTLAQTFNVSPMVVTTAATAAITLDSSNPQARRVIVRTNGSNRWQFGGDNAAESGSNAGSNYQCVAYDDSGTSLGNAYSIERATRAVTFTVSMTCPSVTHSGSVFDTGIESPAQFTANVDNLAIASTTRVLRIQSDASRDLTGIVATTSGRRVLLCNVGSNNIVLVHSATSTAANQFRCPGSANFTLNTNDSVEIWYDSVNSRWRVLGF